MDNLLLAPQAQRHLEALLLDTPHAVLLVGPTGIGKYTIALAVAAGITQAKDVVSVRPDEKGTISIDAIRSLYRQTRVKQENRQVIIIDRAECMGGEAQNAFLKLLEEPRDGVTFVLTAPTDDVLLPTIASRVQSIAIPRCSQAQMQQFVTDLQLTLEPHEIAQLLFVANGRPAVVARLSQAPDVFNHFKQLMRRAKEVLGASPYERLSLVTQLTKDREDTIVLLEAMARMIQLQLLRDPTAHWIVFAERLEQCLSRLAQNGNARSQLTALFAYY